MLEKFRVPVLAVGFVLFFVAGFFLARSLPALTEKAKAAAVKMDSEPEAAATLKSSPQGVGATRDLSAIVHAYQKRDELAKVAIAGGEVATDGTSTISTSAPRTASAVRTPPPDMKLIRQWPTGRKWVALTFDDGPHPTFTEQFLELLKQKNVRATFFLLGPNVKSRPDLVQRIVAEGHELGNHSWSHATLSKLSPDKIRDEIVKTNALIKEVAGVDVQLLRPPYGSANKKVQDICEQLGLRIICWNVDTDDWRKTTTQEKMIDIVKKNAGDGAIVLMHDRFDKSLKTTEQAIDYLRSQGYEFVTVSELIGLRSSPPAVTVAVAAGTSTTVAASPLAGGIANIPVVASANSQPKSPGATPHREPDPTPTPLPSTRQGTAEELPAVSPEKITTLPKPSAR